MTQKSSQRYVVRFATNAADIAAAQSLRSELFLDGQGQDSDGFDDTYRHGLIEEEGVLIACFRLMIVRRKQDLHETYTGQFYGLENFNHLTGPFLDLGRFCIRPERKDPNILRSAWAFLTRLVDGEGVQIMMGCTSFEGTDITPYQDALSLLANKYIAPNQLIKQRKAVETIQYAKQLSDHIPNLRQAQRSLPALLKTYMIMGGWVSDFAVVDRDLNTFHIFTGVEVAKVPEARARALRAMAD